MALYILLLITTHIPACQRIFGGLVADAVSERLATKVNVGSIDLGFLNRVIINDVTLYDQQNRIMLLASRMSVKIDLLALAEGKISISSAQLFGANGRFYKRNAESKPNYQFVLDSLASKDTTSTSPLDLRINSLIIRRSSILYDQGDIPKTDGLFNPHHLRISNISANIALKRITEDSIDVNVKRLGLTEQSGLELNNLTFRFQAGKKNAELKNLCIEMPSTKIAIDTLKASYIMEKEKLLTEALEYEGCFTDSHITPSDLRCFYNQLKNFQRPIHLQSNFRGKGYTTTIPELHIWTETGDVNILASGLVDTSNDKPSWSAKVNDLALSENTLDFLQKTIPDIPREILNIGNLRLRGNLNGESDGGMSVQTQIQTGIGNIDLDFLMSGTKQFNGSIDTEGIDLRQLLGDEQMGLLAASLKLDGEIASKIPTVNAQGMVSRMDYKGYPFTNIGINGSYSDKGVAGFLKIEDPNLSAEVEGNMAKTGATNSINIKGVLNHLAPKALKLSDNWGDAIFAANLDADLTAKTINDAQGKLRISNFSMVEENGNQYNLDNLYLTSGFEDDLHYVTLVSDFAKAEIKGEFEHTTLSQSIINFVASALPTLPGLPQVKKESGNNFNLRLQVFKTDWLQKLLGMNISIANPVTLRARVNDNTKTINLEGLIPDITYDGSRYTNGNIVITTPSDSIKGDVALNKIMDDGSKIDLSLKAVASDNNLTISLAFKNNASKDDFSGNLNLITSLYKNNANQPEAHIRVQPSHLILNGATWAVETSDIIYNADKLYVNQFSINNGQQHLIIDGKATASREDTITVDLNEMEVAYILDLVNFHSVEFSGRASGSATVVAPFGDFAMNADIVVDDFKFERGHMGTLYAEAAWIKERGQIDIDAIADDGLNSKTFVNGYVSPTYNTIDLQISADGTYLDFMHNFTKTFLSSITGQGHGDVRLAGTLDNINLTGQLIIDEGKAEVTALNTTYTLTNDTVNFIPDEIELHQMAVYDADGNKGTLSGGIHHKHLTSMTYDLFVEADNLLAYDFRDFGESSFYGTVYASGDVAIHGRSGEVVIDCNVTPQKNTVFVYNASSPDAISNQEFIEWGSGSKTEAAVGKADEGKRISEEEIDIPTDIYINFLVNCTPDATMRILMDANTSDYITLNGEGTIRATFHNKGPFNMFGTYTVDHGTYGITIQNIIKKNFTFNRGGTIVFGGDPYNAALNLQAVYTVNGVSLSDLNIGNSFASNTIRVNCLMNIGGMPNSPKVEFDLEMPTVNADEQQMVRSIINGQQEMNQQVLYLLGIGRFYNQGANNSGTDQSDRTTLAMQSFLSGTLSTQINTLLSTVIKNDNWNFGANISTGNEGWHNAEYEGLISGRMLNNRLLLNGQFGYRDNARQATPSFIGDFDLQYLLFPNGNLALKVYNQTNDRYFTKSSLNTQGIGVIMKKDFNGLKDLFSTKKKKKRKEKSK